MVITSIILIALSGLLSKLKDVKENLPLSSLEDNGEKGRVVDIVSKKTCISRGTYERSKLIIEEGTEEVKEKLRNNKTTISKEYDKIRRDQKREELSIVQAAGRCNRNGLRSNSESFVYIFVLCDDRGNPLAHKIYGNTLIFKTRETFKEVRKKSSNLFQLSELVDIYYKKVKEGGSQKDSREILNYIQQLDYENIEKNFKVLEDEPSVSVFIEIDEKAEGIWKEYEIVINNQIPEENKKKKGMFFLKNRDIFYSYVINTWPEIADKLSIPFKDPFYYIDRKSIEKYYNNDTGLKVTN